MTRIPTAFRALSPSNRAFAVFLAAGVIGTALIHLAAPFLFVACVALVVSVGLARHGRDDEGG